MGSILFACGLLGAVVVLVVGDNRPQSAASSASAPRTTAPTSSPELIACNILSIPDVTKCRSMVKFEPYNAGDKTTGSTIPSEIELLT